MGRKRKFSNEQVKYITEVNKTALELAKEMQCSIPTIYRVVNHMPPYNNTGNVSTVPPTEVQSSVS